MAGKDYWVTSGAFQEASVRLDFIANDATSLGKRELKELLRSNWPVAILGETVLTVDGCKMASPLWVAQFPRLVIFACIRKHESVSQEAEFLHDVRFKLLFEFLP